MRCTFITKEKIYVFLIGQAISLLGVINGLTCNFIQNDYKADIPITLALIFYISLFFIFLMKKPKTNKPKLIFIIIAFSESQGNVLNIFSFTKLRFNFPFIINISGYTFTLILTYFLIKTYKHTIKHLCVSIFSLIGISISILSIIFSSSEEEDVINFNVIGLILSLVSSLFYSISAVLQEKYLNEEENIDEYFKSIGLFSSIILIIEGFALSEFNLLIDIYFIIDYKIFSLFYAFLISLLLFAIISSNYIRIYSASAFNISLLFQIFWSYIFDLLLGKSPITKFYFFIGIAIIFISIIIFNILKVRKNQIPILEINNTEIIDSLE